MIILSKQGQPPNPSDSNRVIYFDFDGNIYAVGPGGRSKLIQAMNNRQISLTLSTQGDTSNPSYVVARLLDGTGKRIAEAGFLRARICNEGGYANATNATLAVGNAGVSVVETHTSSKDLTFKSQIATQATGTITSDNTNVADDVAATGTLTSNNTNVSNNQTVTIGNKTYTFKTALTPTEGEVLIGADADGSLLNLIRAINHTGTPDTDYKCAAAHTQVTAAGSVTSHAFAITARTAGSAGNSIATTETSATLSFGGATLSGGADAATVTIGNKTYTFRTALTPTEGEVLIGADADGSLLNLIRAINHTGTPNTDYKCAAAHTQVTAAASVTAHAFAVTAIEAGEDGNDIVTTETSGHLSWGAATLETGVDADPGVWRLKITDASAETVTLRIGPPLLSPPADTDAINYSATLDIEHEA